jgi:hypothetical protein
MPVIYFERKDSLGHIVLANPPKNLIESNFSNALKQAVHEASESDIRALLVRRRVPISAKEAMFSTSWRRIRTSSEPSSASAISRSAP